MKTPRTIAATGHDADTEPYRPQSSPKIARATAARLSSARDVYEAFADQTTVLIAGCGIDEITVALTLHQNGVRCVVFESVRDLKPLGVGIKLRPIAVRELFDLGIGENLLDPIGVQTKESTLVRLNGDDVCSELRGVAAGYR